MPPKPTRPISPSQPRSGPSSSSSTAAVVLAPSSLSSVSWAKTGANVKANDTMTVGTQIASLVHMAYLHMMKEFSSVLQRDAAKFEHKWLRREVQMQCRAMIWLRVIERRCVGRSTTREADRMHRDRLPRPLPMLRMLAPCGRVYYRANPAVWFTAQAAVGIDSRRATWRRQRCGFETASNH